MFASIRQRWFGKKSPARRSTSFRPRLDVLEDRLALTALPTLIAPTGSILDASPSFSWNAAAGATTYELWVDDTTAGQSALVHKNFATNAAPVQALTAGDSYAWWVRAFDDAGNHSAWSAMGTFTIALLSVPRVLNAPSATIQTTLPGFGWNTVTGADKYELWVDNLTKGVSPWVHYTMGSTNIFASILRNEDGPGDTFTWYVRALGSNGNRSPWTSAMTFTVVRPDAPVPFGPSGTLAALPNNFAWSSEAPNLTYSVWLQDETTATTQHFGIGSMETSPTVHFVPPSGTLVRGHVYDWWVRTINQGSTSLWSDMVKFQVPLDTPAPSPNATTLSWQPTFSWAAATGADHYEFWADDTTTGQSAVLHASAVSGTSFTPAAPLTQGHAYKWYVRALVSNGIASAWTSGATLTVAVPATPTPVSPSGASENAAPNFVWGGNLDVTAFDIWVDDLTTGQSPVARRSDIRYTQPVFTAILALGTVFTPGHTYAWYIRGFHADGNPSAWSAATTFAVAPLPAPRNLTYGHGGISQYLTWDNTAGTDYYDVWVDDVTTGQSQVVRNKHLLPSIDPDGGGQLLQVQLTRGHQYQWWVRAYNNSGDYSDWSAGSFTT